MVSVANVSLGCVGNEAQQQKAYPACARPAHPPKKKPKNKSALVEVSRPTPCPSGQEEPHTDLKKIKLAPLLTRLQTRLTRLQGNSFLREAEAAAEEVTRLRGVGAPGALESPSWDGIIST